MSRSQSRRKSLRTEADDLFYDEYLRLRNGQRGGVHSRRDDRLPPLPRTSDSLVSLDGRRQRTAASFRTLRTQDSVRSTSTVASAKVPNFKREGYEQMNSRLGDDPLTAVRLMRAQMAQMSLRERLNDRDVKSQFAREASRILLRSEQELEALQRKRTDALIRGDTLEARRITREMQDIRAKATYDAYSDLLLNEQELASYGVRSKYAPKIRRRDLLTRDARDHTSEERRGRDIDTRDTRSRRHSTQETSTFNRYIYTPPNQRSVSRGRRNRRRPFTEDSIRSQTAPPPNRRRGSRRDKTGVKKNKRLADMPPPPNVCPQCYERNPALMSEEGLKNHWNQFCACLTRCQYCDQVLHVSDLNNHHINNCEFVNGALKPCPLCGLAQYEGNSNHPNCNLKPPPPGAAWCPLCSKPVKPFSSKAAWRKHLIDDCYNNPRNNKRWSGRNAPSNGNSLLGSLAGQPTFLPTEVGPAAQPRPNNVQVNAQPNRAAPAALFQPNAPVGGNPQVLQQISGPLNPNQLRIAYNKLRAERRDDYIKQQNLDAAVQAEKEDEEV